MTRLVELFEKGGQSPWIDNLTRDNLSNGEMAKRIAQGIRGATSNPTIFEKALADSDSYDAQLQRIGVDVDTEQAYWQLATTDITNACDLFMPVYNSSSGEDGYVSLEVSPALAYNGNDSVTSALVLADAIDRPNLMIKIPATLQALFASTDLVAAGINTNVTLIFSIARYESVVEAYIAGIERLAEQPEADLSKVRGVASFFLSRIDTKVDAILEEIGTDEALSLRGSSANASAQLAHRIFQEKFNSPRWNRLEDMGANPQRPLWASTSCKNPEYSDLIYVEPNIGPNTVTTLPEVTIDAFLDHGLTRQSLASASNTPLKVMGDLAKVGVDMNKVAIELEQEGVEAFRKSHESLLNQLEKRRAGLSIS